VISILETHTTAKEESLGGISPALAAKLASNNSSNMLKDSAEKDKPKQRSSTISGRVKESKPSAMSLFKRGSVKAVRNQPNTM